MAINLDGIELTDEQKQALIAANEGYKSPDEYEQDTAGLKAKRDELLKTIADNKEKQKQAESEAEKQRLSQLEKEKNYKELAASYQEKLAEIEKQRNEEALAAQAKTLDATALELAGQIADGPNAKLLSRFIRERLGFVDGNQVVLNSEGQTTVSTTEQLVQEFKDNKDFSALITVTRANGGAGGKPSEGNPNLANQKLTNNGAINDDAVKERLRERISGGPLDNAQ